MGENNSSKLQDDGDGGGGGKSRRALGDVTNQLENRGFKLVSRSPASKSLSGNKRSAENSDDDSQFWRQVSMVVDKLEKERCGVVKCPKVASSDVGLSPLKGGKIYRLQTSSVDVGSVGVSSGMGNRNVGGEVKGDHVSALDCIDLGDNQPLVDVGDGVQEGFFSSGCCEMGCVEVGKECEEGTRGYSDEGDSDCSPEGVAEQVVSDCGKSVAVDCMTSSKSDSVVSSGLMESQETKSFGLQRCTNLKEDGSNDLDAEIDLLKNCSCSFCTKAAYIWSDLQCQDVKGRISILTKSQKEASNFAKRYSLDDITGGAQGNSSTASQLEGDLTNLWKSLFLHMERIYTTENTQLQTNYTVLKDLREDCKMNLEIVSGMPSDVQQCSSDASEL